MKHNPTTNGTDIQYATKVMLFCDIDKYFYDRLCPKITYKFRDHDRRSVGLLWAFCGFSVSNICASIIMMQKVAANVDNVAADLCFRASEVRWLLMKIFFCYCRYFCR